MANQLTTQQANFVRALLETTANLALVARAGTGKTSTILAGVTEYIKKFPAHQIIVCAFNKSIADEVGAKLEKLGIDWKKARAATIHSLGWGLVRFHFRLGKENINDNKVRDIIEAQNADVYKQYGSQIKALVHHAKVAGFGFFPDLQIGSRDAWYALADHHDINGFEDTTEMDPVVEAAQHIYRASLAETNIIDFDDMVLFPLIKNIRVKFTVDAVIIDEYQDTSRARQALARKFVRPATRERAGGRMVAVGDDRQAIYGFAGADADALASFITEMEATVLPLTKTWRCGRVIVNRAKTLVPDIECATDREGAERFISLQAFQETTLEKTDAILCRNTAPLIEIAYSLIRKGVACKVEGRAIGDGLKALAQRWKVKTIDKLLVRLEDWKEREVQKYNAKKQEAKAEAAADRADTLKHLCEACLAKGQHAVDDVVAFIDSIFADGATGCLILATYHRSKGREWDRVFLWEHNSRCPSKAARQDWQQKQEANLAYVAWTRAKEELVWVN